VSHTIADKAKLIARVRRIKGQVEAIERALDAEAECSGILQLTAAVRGAVGGLTIELMESHIREHIVDLAHDADPTRARGAQELIDILRTYLK
jgi:DNA-binding FrmR family transcriptional regulator